MHSESRTCEQSCSFSRSQSYSLPLPNDNGAHHRQLPASPLAATDYAEPALYLGALKPPAPYLRNAPRDPYRQLRRCYRCSVERAALPRRDPHRHSAHPLAAGPRRHLQAHAKYGKSFESPLQPQQLFHMACFPMVPLCICSFRALPRGRPRPRRRASAWNSRSRSRSTSTRSATSSARTSADADSAPSAFLVSLASHKYIFDKRSASIFAHLSCNFKRLKCSHIEQRSRRLLAPEAKQSHDPKGGMRRGAALFLSYTSRRSSA